MPSTRTIRQMIKHAIHENRYISEVITVQQDDNDPVKVFSVQIEPDNDTDTDESQAIRCTVLHHTELDTHYQRETTYPTAEGPPRSSHDELPATLTPEVRYLMEIDLAEGWLVSSNIRRFKSPADADDYRLIEKVITLKEAPVPADELAFLNNHAPESRGDALLDLLRQWDFTFNLRRQRMGTETIYVQPVEPDRPRYLLCAGYRRDTCGTLAILEMLRCIRSERLSMFRPGARYATLEIAFLDDLENSHSGAWRYLYSLKEAERNRVKGAIYLDLTAEGNQPIITLPPYRGDARLSSALYQMTRYSSAYLKDNHSSEVAELFTEQEIPFAAVSVRQNPDSSADADADEKHPDRIDGLQHVAEFLRNLSLALTHVRGDEIDDYQPELLALQDIPRKNLISLDDDDNTS
jgi:hypothetical protein